LRRHRKLELALQFENILVFKAFTSKPWQNKESCVNSNERTEVEGTSMGQQENIVRYWHSVELLQPQSAPKLKKRSNVYDAFIHDTSIHCPILPWEPESIVSKQLLPKKRIWSHTLYAHLYDSQLVARKLHEVFGADRGYREPQHRKSALFATKFTSSGEMVDDSFVLSSEAWFLGRVLTGNDWTQGFDSAQEVAGGRAEILLTDQVSGYSLQELTEFILDSLGLAEFLGRVKPHVFRFRSQPVKSNKTEPEDDPLNSFLLNDLARVADSIGKGIKSKPLQQYLQPHHPSQRLHLDDDAASLSLIDRLMPDVHPSSCWPSEQHLGLVHSQQLAINTIVTQLADSQGLLGVNGPPGTGKTTLLRDLIAAIITGRADELAKLPRASDGFVRGGREEANDGGRQQVGFKLNPALYGFEIVVASSNNGAVENITLELPQRNKIDESWLPEAEYFAELGELSIGKPAWGLISGALGSKARRTKFVNSYFFGQRLFLEDDTEVEPDQATQKVVDDHSFGKKEHSNSPPENEKEQHGFLAWLNTHAKINAARSSEQRQVLWREAVSDYTAVKAEERKVREDASNIRRLIHAICETRKLIHARSKTLRTLAQKLADTAAKLAHLDTKEGRPANLELKRCMDALKQHEVRKPSFWEKLFSLWASQRHWNTQQKFMEGEFDLASAEFARIARLTKELDISRQGLEKETAEVRGILLQLREDERVLTQNAVGLAHASQADHLVTWLRSNKIDRSDAIERAEPWRIKGWRQLRARVFLQALKLHRTFFELEANRMRSNLFLINGLLTGSRFRGFSDEAIRSAWTSLFMVVPVLSSTFSSFARSFGSLQASDIGWLLVDEAGQTPPQAVVGALWRSRRAVLVGDPFQLKPIVTVPDAVLENMRTRYRVDPHWLPNRQSAQTLADEATLWGRMAGPVAKKTWVGLPLVVHRRCDKPMHELANRIAYDNAMVYGTLAPDFDKETRASLPTGWIHASGQSEENWVPAEGKALQELLALLRADGVEDKDISVITPFTDVRNNLKRILNSGMVFGTIHTMQGKETPIVIMVLGGKTAGSGARNWAVSEPNLLNVAATRAKRRFYVIGDRDDWKNRALFCDIMDLLPLQEIAIREQAQASFSRHDG
jgi:hypothetical protein